MALYTIGDLHLSLGSNKPMDIFGERWQNYVEKIRQGFSTLTENDTTVLCGDLSWGMSLEESLNDFRFIGKDVRKLFGHILRIAVQHPNPFELFDFAKLF